ncbi:MAG: prolipoprotein diacylglyceryl transferase [Deltaproteobacteria bacterium]|nr:prolipoprotein diacylglyceryl transferase [Deltaproteobacteria bacterium]
MHPILLQLGPISIKTYGFLIATGFLMGISLAVRDAKQENFDPQIILDLAFYMIIGAIVGSRIFYVFTNLSYFLQHPLDIFKIWQGGLVFFGGFILSFSICVWMIKRNGLQLLKTLDLFAPSLAIGVCFGRLGCFFAGCCYGKACELPWAITFTNPDTLARMHVPLHPTQLYSSLGALITFLILFFWRKRKTFDGQLLLIWLFMYSGFRSIIELFRGDIRGDMWFDKYATSQILAWALVMLAVGLYPVFKRKYPLK